MSFYYFLKAKQDIVTELMMMTQSAVYFSCIFLDMDHNHEGLLIDILKKAKGP